MSRLAFGGQGKSGVEAKYKFAPLPWEEQGANEDIYVCEFTGAAGANEVGVGAGLSGADLVLTQYANPGSDGTYRTIQNGTFQSFYGTTPFYEAFGRSPHGWSVLYRCKSINGASSSLMRLSATDAAGGGNSVISILAMGGTSNGFSVASANHTNGVASGITLPGNSTRYPVAGESYAFVGSLDYVNGIGFAGILVDRGVFPTGLSDFLFFSINDFDPYSGPGAIAGYAYSDYYKCIIGSFLSYGLNYSGGQTPMSLTLSKRPCYIPA